MARVDITQLEALNAIIAHFRSDLALDDSRVFLTIDPLAVRIPRGADWWLTISVGEYTFMQELLTGGVFEQCTEDTTFTVTAYVRMHLDQADHDDQLVLDSTRGLFELKRIILKSLAGIDLQVGVSEFARELFSPRFSRAPMVVSVADGDSADDGLQIGIISVTYGMMFDWDLT